MSSIFSWRIGKSSKLIFFFPVALMGRDFYLLPSSFEAAVGERLTVRVHYGAHFPNSDSAPVLADSGIYTTKAAYSLVNAHAEGNSLVLEGNLKAAGVAILAAESKPRTENGIRYLDFAKAIVVVEKADSNATKRLGAILEIVPMALPKLGDVQFRVLFLKKPLETPLEISIASDRITNANGLFHFDAHQRYLLRARHTEGDTVYSATLTFEVR